MKLEQINLEDLRKNETLSKRLDNFIRDNENISLFKILGATKQDIFECLQRSPYSDFAFSYGKDFQNKETFIIATTEPNARAKVVILLAFL